MISSCESIQDKQNDASWAYYHWYVKIRVARAPGMPGTLSPPSRVSDPDKHHGMCVTHVSWCMLGSLTSGFLSSRFLWERSPHSRRMHNPQFYIWFGVHIALKFDRRLGSNAQISSSSSPSVSLVFSRQSPARNGRTRRTEAGRLSCCHGYAWGQKAPGR